MVAPSFQLFEFIGEVFKKNGRDYIRVKNPKTGNIREVRWYSEEEYNKAYGEKPKTKAKTPGDGIDGPWEFYWTPEGHEGLKHARGFDNGPILIIHGVETEEDKEWCKQSCAQWAVGMGWYIASTSTFPEDAPDHFKYVALGWHEFIDGDERHQKRPSQIAKIIAEKVQKKQFINMKGAKNI